MIEFTWPVQIGATGNTAYKVTKNEFEGYTQRVGEGINNKLRSWSLTYLGDSSTIPDVKAFLDLHAGVEPFLWQPPGSTGKIPVTCEGYSDRTEGMDVETLSFTFEIFLSVRSATP